MAVFFTDDDLQGEDCVAFCWGMLGMFPAMLVGIVLDQWGLTGWWVGGPALAAWFGPPVIAVLSAWAKIARKRLTRPPEDLRKP